MMIWRERVEKDIKDLDLQVEMTENQNERIRRVHVNDHGPLKLIYRFILPNPIFWIKVLTLLLIVKKMDVLFFEKEGK